MLADDLGPWSGRHRHAGVWTIARQRHRAAAAAAVRNVRPRPAPHRTTITAPHTVLVDATMTGVAIVVGRTPTRVAMGQEDRTSIASDYEHFPLFLRAYQKRDLISNPGPTRHSKLKHKIFSKNVLVY